MCGKVLFVYSDNSELRGRILNIIQFCYTLLLLDRIEVQDCNYACSSVDLFMLSVC